MTKTKNKPTKHKSPIIVILVIFLILAVGVAIFLFINQQDSNDSQSTPEDSATSTNLPSSDESSIKRPDPADPDEPEKVTQFEGENPNQLENLTGHIAYAGVYNNTLTITATIDQFISGAGNCALTLSQNNQTVYTSNLPTEAEVSTSACGPFDIPISNLSPGDYNITITITGNNKSGTITGQTKI